MEEKIYFLEAKKITSNKDCKQYNIFKYLSQDFLKYNSVIVSDKIMNIILDEEFDLFEELTLTYTISKNKKVYISDINR